MLQMNSNLLRLSGELAPVFWIKLIQTNPAIELNRNQASPGIHCAEVSTDRTVTILIYMFNSKWTPLQINSINKKSTRQKKSPHLTMSIVEAESRSMAVTLHKSMDKQQVKKKKVLRMYRWTILGKVFRCFISVEYVRGKEYN